MSIYDSDAELILLCIFAPLGFLLIIGVIILVILLVFCVKKKKGNGDVNGDKKKKGKAKKEVSFFLLDPRKRVSWNPFFY